MRAPGYEGVRVPGCKDVSVRETQQLHQLQRHPSWASPQSLLPQIKVCVCVCVCVKKKRWRDIEIA